jgi:translation initiation factor IF-2
MAGGKLVGKVTHYYDKAGVAIIELVGTLKVGDKIKFVKGDEEVEQTISSMQIERAGVESAKKGQIIGIKADSIIKEGTQVYSL